MTTSLFLASHGERTVWLLALIGEDIYCYVANTGLFHLNAALRDDFFMEREFAYSSIGVTQARRLIEEGVGALDEEQRADSLAGWRSDPSPLRPEDVFAAAVADLA